MLSLVESQRAVLVEEFLEKECWSKTVAWLNFSWETKKMEVVGEITWIFQIVFATTRSLTSDIATLGILPTYEKILATDDEEVLDNVV